MMIENVEIEFHLPAFIAFRCIILYRAYRRPAIPSVTRGFWLDSSSDKHPSIRQLLGLSRFPSDVMESFLP